MVDKGRGEELIINTPLSMVCVMNQCYENEEEDSHRDYAVGNYNRYLPGSQKTSELSVFNSWQSQRCEQKYRHGKNSRHHDKIGAKAGNVGGEEPTSFEKGKIVIFFFFWHVEFFTKITLRERSLENGLWKGKLRTGSTDGAGVGELSK